MFGLYRQPAPIARLRRSSSHPGGGPELLRLRVLSAAPEVARYLQRDFRTRTLWPWRSVRPLRTNSKGSPTATG